VVVDLVQFGHLVLIEIDLLLHLPNAALTHFFGVPRLPYADGRHGDGIHRIEAIADPSYQDAA